MTLTRALVVLCLATAVSACSRPASAGRSGPTVSVVQTDEGGSRGLTRMAPVRFAGTRPRRLRVIAVDDGVRLGRFEGAGAALTDSSAWLLADLLAPQVRASVLAKLFTHAGIALNYLRLPIGASDYTRGGRPYSYDDVPVRTTDPTLARFSIAHDTAYVIPMLKQILALNPGVRIIAAPWSPPAWMKTNDALDNTNGRGGLRPGTDAVLARYLVAFVTAYARLGIPVAAITPQNEPGQAADYPGLALGARGEARLITGFLAPALRASGVGTSLYGHDLSWRRARRAETLLADPAVRADIAGVAWHCYEGNPGVMRSVHREWPAMGQLVTECSDGLAPGPPAEIMIAALRNGASAMLLWNLALNGRGGPVQPPGRGCPACTGVVTVDERAHAVTFGRDYFELGQFTAFIRRGAVRIASNHFVTYRSPLVRERTNIATSGLDDIAYLNPDGRRVLVVHNNAARREPFAVAWRSDFFDYTLPGGATATFTWP